MGLRTAAFNAYVCYSDVVEVRHPPQPRPLRPYFLLFLLVANILAVEGQQQVFNISRPSGTGILEYFPLEGENKDDGGGVCLDGSPAGYYYRPGQGPGANKFLLYYEGGGWCTSDRDCHLRAQTPLGSSKEWLPYMEASTCLGSYFLNTSSNPLHDWNILFMKYCDGSSFSSMLLQAVPVTTQFLNASSGEALTAHVYYRGQRIHDALLDTFVRRHGLLEASDVVVAGCSAGGLSVYLHVDEVAARFTGRAGARVRGLADSGFFVDTAPPSALGNRGNEKDGGARCEGGQSGGETLRWLASRQFAPALSPEAVGCLAAGGSGPQGEDAVETVLGAGKVPGQVRRHMHAGPSTRLRTLEALFPAQSLVRHTAPPSPPSLFPPPPGDTEAEVRARCLFARHLLPSLRTPVFSFFSRYDGAQTSSFACLTDPEGQAEAVNAASRAFVRAFRESLAASAVPHGYFIDACFRHCFWELVPAPPSFPLEGSTVGALPMSSSVINPWTSLKAPSGRSAAEIFLTWYEGRGGLDDWREERTEAFPCLSCCRG